MRTLKFGIIALGLMSTTMVSAQERGNGDKLFAKMDTNSDGVVSKAEFLAAKEGKTNKKGEPIDAEKRFEKMDLNGDGNFDRAEFDQLREEHAERVENRPERDHGAMFAKFDTNKDGLISKAEFTAKHEGKTNKKGEPINSDKRFEKMDSNSDGNIDKTEFENAKKAHEAKKK